MIRRSDLTKLILFASFIFLVANSASGQFTTTALTTSKNPACDNNYITFTATITPDVGANGTVDFFDGATLLGSSSVSGSVAVFTTSTYFTAGNHSITAVYSGGGGFYPSTSPLPRQ